VAKLCLLSDQSLVGQSRTPRANSTEARRDEEVHRLVSDVEQLIGIHADRDARTRLRACASLLLNRSNLGRRDAVVRQMGSVHSIIPAAELRPSIVAAVERGMALTVDALGH
jgi:hypothetical protein